MSTPSLLLVAAIATSPAAAMATEWQFIGTATDETVYFGKKLVTEGGITVIRVKAVGDPEEPQPYVFSHAVKCASNQFMNTDRAWKPVEKGTMGSLWFQFACKK